MSHQETWPRTARIEVEVRPGAGRDGFLGLGKNHRLRIQLRAIPEQGKANEALLRFLSRSWALPLSAFCMGRGATSSRKTLWVQLRNKEEREALEQELAHWSPWIPLLVWGEKSRLD